MKSSSMLWVLVVSGFVILSAILGAGHIWRNVSDPASELFNKGEWSAVQTLQQRSDDLEFSDEVKVTQNASGSENYDAVGLPRLDKQGWIWLISNAEGIPRIKVVSQEAPRNICKHEFDRVVSAVRLNTDVETLLRVLTRPDCLK